MKDIWIYLKDKLCKELRYLCEGRGERQRRNCRLSFITLIHKLLILFKRWDTCGPTLGLCNSGPQAIKSGPRTINSEIRGNQLWASDVPVWTMGDQLWASFGNQVWASGDQLWALGDQLWASDNQLWAFIKFFILFYSIVTINSGPLAIKSWLLAINSGP